MKELPSKVQKVALCIVSIYPYVSFNFRLYFNTQQLDRSIFTVSSNVQVSKLSSV